VNEHLPRKRGRPKAWEIYSPAIESVRGLTAQDLRSLPTKGCNVTRLRDQHLAIAKAFAAGYSTDEVAKCFGYTACYIRDLRRSALMDEAIAQYSEDPDIKMFRLEPMQEMYQLAMQGTMLGLQQIVQHFQDANEEGKAVALKDALATVAALAGRGGLPETNQSINHNVNYGNQLNDAIRRMRGGKLIDQKPRALTSPKGEGRELHHLRASRPSEPESVRQSVERIRRI
jgi:hypothetical protein